MKAVSYRPHLVRLLLVRAMEFGLLIGLVLVLLYWSGLIYNLFLKGFAGAVLGGFVGGILVHLRRDRDRHSIVVTAEDVRGPATGIGSRRICIPRDDLDIDRTAVRSPLDRLTGKQRLWSSHGHAILLSRRLFRKPALARLFRDLGLDGYDS